MKTYIVISFPENPSRKNIYPKLGTDKFYWNKGQSLIFSLDKEKTDKMTDLSEICDNSIFITDITLERLNYGIHNETILSGYLDTKKHSYVKCQIKITTQYIVE